MDAHKPAAQTPAPQARVSLADPEPLPDRLDNDRGGRIPGVLLAGLLVACVAPFALLAAGVDFGYHGETMPTQGNFAPTTIADTLIRRFFGHFAYAVVEWSAFCAALFTLLLASVHFSVKRRVAVPILCIAYAFSAAADALYALPSVLLVESTQIFAEVVPRTWATGRLISGVLLISAMVVVLADRKRSGRPPLLTVLITSLGLGFITYGAVTLAGGSSFLSLGAGQTWPVMAASTGLLLFVVTPTFWWYHRLSDTTFSHALLLSVVPNLGAQFTLMVSVQAFDSVFNVAHYLKALVYLLPLTGLCVATVRAYQQQREGSLRLEHARQVLLRQQRVLQARGWALEEQKKALLEANQELEQQISDRVRIEQHLMATAQRLEISNRELERFAELAAHDLQEPMRKVRIFGDRLNRRYRDQLDGAGASNIDRMTDAAARMQDLIHDLLTFSKVNTQGQPLVRTDLGYVAQRVLDGMSTRITELGAQVTLGEMPEAVVDPGQLRQVIEQLVDNALKFAKQGEPPEIHIFGHTLSRSKSPMGAPVHCLVVQDKGIGFDEKYSGQIFQVFKRLHAQSQFAGTGMGLALSRRIVERHGGYITADSAPGRGATFTVYLPVQGPRLLAMEPELGAALERSAHDHPGS